MNMIGKDLEMMEEGRRWKDKWSVRQPGFDYTHVDIVSQKVKEDCANESWAGMN